VNLALIGIGALAIAVYGLVSGRLSRSVITGPMFFAAIGLVAVSLGTEVEPSGDVTGLARVALEMTLALVLFTDAMATNVSSWRGEGELPTRLLAVGMPLIILAGAVVAMGLFPDIGVFGAAILATILAPTDAALGKPVVSNPRVPARIRAALNVESGLNDGIALPFLLFFIAMAEAEEGANLLSLLVSAIGIAILVGLLIGWVFARAVVICSERDWMVPIWRKIAVVALPVVAYVAADELGGSGFMAAFVAGLVFGRIVVPAFSGVADFADDSAEVLTMVAFLIFGGALLQPRFGEFTGEMLVYAVASLTLVRMLPVAVAMIGAHLRIPSLLYMGWFGPRGLASLIFAAVVMEDASVAGTETITTVVILTVGLSILLHGITAYPGSNAYADWYEGEQHRDDDLLESEDVASTQQRRRIHRT